MQRLSAAKTFFPQFTTSSTFEAVQSTREAVSTTVEALVPITKASVSSSTSEVCAHNAKNVLFLPFLGLVVAGLLAHGVAADSTPLFRMDKINFVWAKAQHRLDGQEAAQKLQEELKKFDTLYVSIKHEQEHHKNTKSLSEADDKLERLLERYNLDDALKAFRIKYKHDSKQQPNINKLADDSAAKRTAKFSDSRLQNLWSKVSTDQDVAAHELNDLHRQFEGLQKIIERYNEVKKDLNELDENEVHDVVDHQQLVREAKALNSGIEDTIEHLKSQIEAVKENPFENESVRKLWLKAKKAPKLIPNELNAIKSELRHLDRHFLKLDHHSQMMDEHRSLHDTEDDEIWGSMESQREKILHKLRKLEEYLNEKLAEHDEL